MSDKTEDPTPKRLRDARNKGQVAQSKDVASTATLIVVFAYVAATWREDIDRLRHLFDLIPRLYELEFGDALGILATAVGGEALRMAVPPMLLAAVTGLLANYFQVGVLFSFQSMSPKLSNLNPAEGLKKIASKKNLLEFIKSTLKVSFLAYLLYAVLKGAMTSLLSVPYGGLPAVLDALGAVMRIVATYTVLAYVAVASADFLLQRHMHRKGLMMSKDEVKQEYKEMEGDPHIKSKRKQLHREMLAGGALDKTRKSTVLVTNPTHLAIALRYEEGETPLPVVMAKGEGVLARRMVEQARAQGIPILQNVPLAHDLYERSDVDRYIPTELIEPVSEVLRWVRELSQEPGAPGVP
jgi:type III secretion protein U